MIWIDTKSDDVYYNFGCELYFASEKRLPDDVFLMWRTSPTLMIGRFQNALGEIDAAYAREHGVAVVRRLSGGGTIYTDMGGWQFTFITDKNPGIEIEFARFTEPVLGLLVSLGVKAELTGRNDITVGGKKISGNAQYRLGPVTVHHGSLLFDTDLDALGTATRPKAYKITSKAVSSVRDRVTNIKDVLPPEHADLTPEEFRRLAVEALADAEYVITEEDEKRIRALADSRFRSEEELWGKTPRFGIEKDVHTAGGTFRIGMTVKNGVIEDAGVEGDFFASPDAAELLESALKGTAYAPESVRRALESLGGRLNLFRAGVEEIARGMFE